MPEFSFIFAAHVAQSMSSVFDYFGNLCLNIDGLVLVKTFGRFVIDGHNGIPWGGW